MHTNPSLLWTLEEISQLVSGSGNPAETLTNIVNLIQQRFETDVCSVYLLEPDRITLVMAATIGLRQESVGRVKMRITEGLAGLVAEQMRPIVVQDATQHPRFKYFREAGEDPYRTFLGVPVVDRGVLQGVLVVQTAEARAFGEDDVRMLSTAGAQLAPIVSEARVVGHFVAPVHQRLAAIAQNLWWSLGRRGAEPVSRARSGPVARVRPQSDRPAPADSDHQLEARASQLALHGRINYAYRRLQEYLQSKHTWGAQHASVLGARPVAYFSAEFGLHESLPIYSGGLGILAGDHLKSASDLGIPLVGIGLYYDQGYFRQRLDDDGWQHEDYLDVDSRLLPIQPATRDGVPLTVGIDTRTGTHLGARLADQRRPEHAAAARLERRGQQPRGPPADVAALRRRSARPHPAGAAARRRRRQGAGGARHLPGRAAPERGAQRICRARADPSPHGDRRRRRGEAMPPRGCTGRIHHAHAGAGRPRSVLARIWSRSISARCATRSGCRYDALMALGRVNPHDANEEFCMTVLALKACRRANAVSSLHGHVSRAMWMPLYPGAARGSRADRSHHQRRARQDVARAADAPGLRPAPRRRLGVAQPASPICWEAIEDVDDGELWEAHQTLKARLIEFTRRRAVLQAERRGEPPAVVAQLRRALSLDALTIGFARRFATYKRANLLLQDLETIAALVNRSADAGAGRSSPARRIRRTARARPCCSRSPS